MTNNYLLSMYLHSKTIKRNIEEYGVNVSVNVAGLLCI